MQVLTTAPSSPQVRQLLPRQLRVQRACKCSPGRPLPHRYANCFRGNSEFNVHAEEFLLEDQALITALDGLEGVEHPKVLTTAAGPAAELAAELTLFMTYQPCHHSGGNVPRGDHARAMYAEHP